MNVSRFRLENGLRIITVPQPHLHVCEMACYVGVGNRHETEELAGISHFLEHMLFRGTSDYPDSLILERAFEAIGGFDDSLVTCEDVDLGNRLWRIGAVIEDPAIKALHLREPATLAALFRKEVWHGHNSHDGLGKRRIPWSEIMYVEFQK